MKTLPLLALLTGAAALAAPLIAPWGVDLSYIDRQHAPGDGFFDYANGGWLKTAKIPPQRTYAGVNLDIEERNEANLRTVVDELVTRPDAQLSPEERKLKDLYAAFMDEGAIEAKGLKPLAATLADIQRLATLEQVAAYMGTPESASDGPFDLAIVVDQSNPAAYIVRLGQAGLGLPDRDYYLGNDAELAATRVAYRKYLQSALAFADIEDAARAQAVYDLELRLARVEWSAEERRDVVRTHNPMSVSALERFAPQFPWVSFLEAAGVSRRNPGGERVLDVAENTAFPALATLFRETPVAVWRDFLAERLVHAHAYLLPKAIADADFAFFGGVLSGRREQLPRNVRAIHLLDANLGEALGKLYCARYFPPESKAKMQELVGNLLKAYAADIRTLDWMSEPTRTKALEKIGTLQARIGYPDTWRDYSRLSIRRDDLIGDVRNAEVFDYRRRLARLDGPVDRGEWEMSPATNNAYNEPTLIEVVFPAGGLQPPFFDEAADDAVNYGAIGATIGHEISHSFDDQGSKYDAAGRLRDWWTPEDRRRFEARIGTVVQQYNRFAPLPGLHLNGALTVGENIADIAGLAIAVKAYHLSLDGRAAPVLDGFTGDQRLFLAYAQSWREVDSDEMLRRSTIEDEHSPARFRTDGVVQNLDAWYVAFGVKPGQKLYLAPAARARLW